MHQLKCLKVEISSTGEPDKPENCKNWCIVQGVTKIKTAFST